MKNSKVTTAMLALVVLASACRMNTRHIIITDGDNYSATRIEYWGKAYFSNDGTTITHITQHGSVKYKKDGQELTAESNNKDEIFYTINDGEKANRLNADQKIFLAQAVKDMIKHGHYQD